MPWRGNHSWGFSRMRIQQRMNSTGLMGIMTYLTNQSALTIIVRRHVLVTREECDTRHRAAGASPYPS